MYPPQAPWTGIGSVQVEVESIKSELLRKANTYEVSTLSSRLDRVEHLVSDVSAEVNRLRDRLQEMEASKVAPSERAEECKDDGQCPKCAT